MPADYVAIYAEVDSRLESVQKKMEEVQKIKADSIRKANDKAKDLQNKPTSDVMPKEQDALR
jgi:hypothetical protein